MAAKVFILSPFAAVNQAFLIPFHLRMHPTPMQPARHWRRLGAAVGDRLVAWSRLACLLPALLGAFSPLVGYAAADKASIFYEDALKRFERQDMEGAVIQLKNSIQQDNKLLAAHMLLGRALSRQGDLKGAEAAFEEALKQGISRAEVALPLGRIYIALGNPTMAIDRFPVTGMPQSIQGAVLAMRGTAFSEMGNPREAARMFEEARRVDPNSAIPLIEEIPVLLQSGQKEKAREYAARAVKLAPSNAAAWNMQASVLHDALDMKAALEAYNKSLTLDSNHVDARVARAALLVDLKRDADAANDLEVLATTAPEEPRSAYLRAMLAVKKRDATSARKHFGEATHVLDTLPVAWIRNREQLLMLAALSHHGLGNLQKAREYLEILLSRNAKNEPARKLLAAIFVQMRDYARATPILEGLKAAYPDDPQIQYQLGRVYLEQKRFPLATDFLTKAVARLGTPEASRALAMSQIGQGRDDLGQATLEKVFSANPRDFEAGMTLATLYKRRNLPQKALQTAEAMVRLVPTNPTLVNFLGTVKGANRDLKGARAAYEQVLARSPNFRPAILNLLKLDEAEGQFENGRKRIAQILAKEPGNVDVLYELGMLERSAGRNDAAFKHLKKASESPRRDTRAGLALIDMQLDLRQFDLVLASAKELASKFPDDLGAQVALARAQIAQGDRAGARSTLQGATRLAEFDADVQVLIGRLQMQADNPDGAAYNVQKALQGRPDDLQALVLSVDAEFRRKDTAKADAALKTLAAKYPDRVETALTIADVAMARGQFGAAIASYQTALAREDSWRCAGALARAYGAAGEFAKSVAFLEGWAKKYPNERLAIKTLAEMQFRAGQLQAARLSYERVFTFDPNDANALNNYANLLLRLNDPGALAPAEKAHKLEPGNSFYAGTLGWVLVQQGKVDAGLRHLRESRLRNPANAENRYHLAYALWKIGRKAEARDELNAAAASNPEMASREEFNRLRKDLGS